MSGEHIELGHLDASGKEHFHLPGGCGQYSDYNAIKGKHCWRLSQLAFQLPRLKLHDIRMPTTIIPVNS